MNSDAAAANQEEIDLLFRAYQRQQEFASERPATPRVSQGMRGPASRIARQQVHQIGALHEDFSRNIAADLCGLLRAPVEARLIGVEHEPHDCLLDRMPNLTYWASVNLPPFDATGVLGLELNLAFPMLDLLLGGDGATPTVRHDLTDIEEQVLEVVVAAICRKLEATWQPLLDLQFAFDRRQNRVKLSRLIPMDEKILSLTFALGLPQARGTMCFAFPAAVASVLLHKITQQYLTPKRRTLQAGSASLRERLKKSHFMAEMILPGSMVRGSELLNLKAGEVLILDHHAGDPVLISVAGQTMFSATPVRVGMARGARVRQRLEPTDETPGLPPEVPESWKAAGFGVQRAGSADEEGDLEFGIRDSQSAGTSAPSAPPHRTGPSSSANLESRIPDPGSAQRTQNPKSRPAMPGSPGESLGETS